MVTLHAGGGINKCLSYSEKHTLQEFSLPKIKNVSPLVSAVSSPSQPSASCSEGLRKCFLSKQGRGQLKIHFLPHDTTTKRWLCQSQDPVSSDDEYRSSTNIAISLFRRYRNVIDRGGTNNLKVDECILWLSIVFITILCTPQPTVVRWSTSPPVSEDISLQWKGFCAIIANAYYVRGMAWLPVKTLQLEQMAVAGHAEEPSLVASRMRLVFSTLEVVSPQWPRA